MFYETKRNVHIFSHFFVHDEMQSVELTTHKKKEEKKYILFSPLFFSFLSFSFFLHSHINSGPRNCIGQRFALAELKIVLAFLLRHYKFESLETRDKIITNMEMVLRPKVPLKVKLHQRHR